MFLILQYNCPECGKIKNNLNDELIYEDTIINNKSLNIIQTFNNNATKELLEVFNVKEVGTPILIDDNLVLNNEKDIVEYLIYEGFL